VSDISNFKAASFSNLLRWLGFGKNDWRQRIAESELPLDVQNVVSNVVVQSRLMNFEKVEVAEDLLAHFQDGRQRGKSFESLINKFGEPEIVAELIRSSKLRSRSMIAKVGKTALFGGVLMGLTYAGLALFFQMGAPNPATDFLAVFNSNQVDVAEEDSAWNVFRETWTRHEFCEGAGGDFKEIYQTELDENGQTVRGDLVEPEDEQWDAAIAKLSDSQDLLAALREGAKRPSLGLALQTDRSQYSDEDFAALFPETNKKDLKPDDNHTGLADISDETNELVGGALLNTLLPHIQSFRKASRILVVDSRWALQSGDTERVVENIETIFGLAHLAADAHCLVCDLVGFAICDIGYDLLGEVLVDAPDLFDEPQLARIQSAVASSKLENWIQFSGEKAFIDDIIQRSYTDDGSGDGRITSEGMLMFHVVKSMTLSNEKNALEDILLGPNSPAAPVSMLLVASRKEMKAKVDQLYGELEKRFSLPIFEDDMKDFEASINGMLIAIAAHRYRLEFGEWPDSAETLTPELLPSVPTDICNGKELNYALNENGFVVYSTGVDGEDDGGVRPISGSEGKPLSTSKFDPWTSDNDGDWINWPRQSE